MLVTCEKDGLTFGERVLRKGQVFKLDDKLAEELKNLSDNQLEQRQKRLYGCIVYRKPTSDELVDAAKADPKLRELMDQGEKAITYARAKTRAAKVQAAVAVLSEPEPEEGITPTEEEQDTVS